MSEVKIIPKPAMEKIIKWDRVGEINKMLVADKLSPAAVAQWCARNGLPISNEKMYEYKRYLLEAIGKQVTVASILGIQGDFDLWVYNPPEDNKKIETDLSVLNGSVETKKAVRYVRSEMELLDHLIHLGMTELIETPRVSIETALKAIDLKNKITGGKHSGLTAHGLEQLRALEKAKFDALVAVVLKYLPEDKHEEVSLEVAKAERKFYEENAPEYLDEYDLSKMKSEE